MSEEIKDILEEMRFKASIYRDHKKRDLSFNDEEKKCALLLDYIQQKENIIKELKNKIKDDKMIIEGNFGCIDNLRKDYNLQKNIIKEVREYIEHENYKRNILVGVSTKKYTRDILNRILDITYKEDKE